MNADRESHWQNATGCSTPADANRLMLEQAEKNKALWDARQYGDEAWRLCWCQSPCGPDFVHGRQPGCVAKEAALRLAGRVT